jgi:hypothetical protein
MTPLLTLYMMFRKPNFKSRPSNSSLLKSYALGKIDKSEFVRAYFDEEIPGDDYFSDLLADAINRKSAEDTERALILMDVLEITNTISALTLAELLLKGWHYCHEQIAMILKEVKNPLTVDSLFHAANLRLEYLDYDDTFQLARKCIKAIAAIGDSKAIEKLNLLAQNDREIIRFYAEKELQYKNRL